MLTSVSFENFKSFAHLEIEDLSHVNIIGGKNSSGKTSILEGLFLYLDRNNPNMLLRQLNWRGVERVPIKQEILWNPIFHDFDINKTIKIHVEIKNSRETLEIKYLEKFKSKRPISLSTGKQQVLSTDRPDYEVKALDVKVRKGSFVTYDSKFMIGHDGFGFQVDQNRSKPIEGAFFGARNKSVLNEDAERYGILDIEGKHEEILDVLRIIEPNIRALSAVRIGDDTILHADVGLGKKMPITFMGDGLSRLLSFSLAIATNPNGIVFIDEIENGLHYSVMEKIWEAIYLASDKFNCQVFATTHSYECLNSAYKAASGIKNPPLRYVRIDRKKGEAKAKVYDFDKLETALNSEIEVR